MNTVTTARQSSSFMPGGGAKAVMVTSSGDSVTVAVGFLLHELTITDSAPSAATPASTSLVGTGSTSVTPPFTTENPRRTAGKSTATAKTRAPPTNAPTGHAHTNIANGA